MRSPPLCASIAACGLAIAACGSGRSDVIVDPPHPVQTVASASASAAPRAPVHVSFEIPRDGAALSLTKTPWPTELARLPDGRIDLRGYPGHDSALLSEYLERASEDLDGFSIAPVVFFHFEGPLDFEDLQRVDTSRSIASDIVLADVDPESPEKGTLYPITLHAFDRDMRYVRKGTLAIRPLNGFVLRPGTLYTAVVRRSFGAVPGGLSTPPDLDAALAKMPRTEVAAERARALHAPAVEALEAMGLPRGDIAAITVFRTGRPHTMLSRLIDTLDGMFEAPSGDKGTAKTKGIPARQKASSLDEGARRAPQIRHAEWDAGLAKPGLYRVIRGTYCTPNFQSRVENAPFLERDGGRVLLDADKRPVVTPVPKDAPFATKECPGQIRARFVLSVPEAAAPKDGYPLLVTAHGTGGDAKSFLGIDDFAGFAAKEGYAAVSTDQPLNGGDDSLRPGAAGQLVLPLGIPIPAGQGGPFLAFYNPLHPGATGGNMHQAQADAAVLVRLFGGLDFAAVKDDRKQPILRGKGLPTPRFDGTRTALAGHSQGCQSIAALGALDPRARAVLLSGCGGDVRIGILRRRIINVSSWISLFLGLDPEELSESHPLLALVQNMADPIDPIAYGRYYWDPPKGRGQQKILHIEGLRDGYNPEAASEALAVALRLSPTGTLVKPIPSLALTGAKASADRTLLQIDTAPGRDGHFVLYDDPHAGEVFRAFLRGAAPAP